MKRNGAYDAKESEHNDHRTVARKAPFKKKME